MSETTQSEINSLMGELEKLKNSQQIDEKTRLILQKIKDFETKLGILTTLQDYKDYILELKIFLRILNNNRKMFAIVENIDVKITKRIQRLYKDALQRFSNDFPLWLAYFNFCKQSNYTKDASITVQNLVKNFPNNAEVWHTAFCWYMSDLNDLNKGLEYLHEGLTLHVNSQLLYSEAIKHELSKISDNDSDEVRKVVCEKLEMYINLICENINDFNYLLEILELLENCYFTMHLQNILICKLLKSYSSEDLVWHILAQREKRGLHFSSNNEVEIIQSKDLNLRNCCQKYQQGLNNKLLSQNSKKNLWLLYLEYLIELFQENKKFLSLLKLSLQQADKDNCLNEKFYLLWLELVADEKKLKILEKATQLIPDSPGLWKLRLRYTIAKGDVSEIDQVFKFGVLALKNKSLPLWLLTLQLNTLILRDDVIIESIYRDGIKESPIISQVLKPKYIEWLAMTKNINEARKKYLEIANIKPYCKELHLIMLKLESSEIDYNFQMWINAHEFLCAQFGQEDVDVWINYIVFYLSYFGFNNNNVERIFTKALENLAMTLQADFKEKCKNIIKSFT